MAAVGEQKHWQDGKPMTDAGVVPDGTGAGKYWFDGKPIAPLYGGSGGGGTPPPAATFPALFIAP